jgi:hypothetical protein
MRIISTLLLVAALAGCATTTSTPTTPSGTAFRGEVWTFDRQTSTVTLRQGDQFVRVKVTPDQINRLELHQTATVYGEVAPPADIERVASAPGTLVPRGQPDQTEATGKVTSTDPAGKATIDSPRGPLTVWTGVPPATPLNAGDEVRVRMRVQPLTVVASGAGAPPPGSEPSMSVTTEPGEYATLTGRVTSVDSNGRLTLESIRGPVTVTVTNAANYRAGDWVEVRTSLHAASR